MEDLEKVAEVLARTDIDFSFAEISIWTEKNINDKIRTEEISRQASACSALWNCQGKN